MFESVRELAFPTPTSTPSPPGVISAGFWGVRMSSLIVSVLMLAACDSSYEVRMGRMTCEPSAEKRDWILECIKNANPQSDEEPEDWIGMCARMAMAQFCPMVPAVYDFHWIACSDLPLNHHARSACDEATW